MLHNTMQWGKFEGEREREEDEGKGRGVEDGENEEVDHRHK